MYVLPPPSSAPSLFFTMLCPLFSPFLFDCQVVNSAWRVSGMCRIHPSCHGRGSVGWADSSWPPCSILQVAVRAEGMGIIHSGTAAPSPAELWALDALREGVCIVPVPQAKCLPVFSSGRCCFLNKHSSLVSYSCFGIQVCAGRESDHGVKEEWCVVGTALGWLVLNKCLLLGVFCENKKKKKM